MEQERDQLVEEMNERKGLFKGKVRKQLQEKIDEKNVRIQNMKGHLVQIVKPYHYDTINAFMKSYKAAKTEYEAYQVSLKNWNGGEESKNNSVVRKLQLGKEKIKDKDQTIKGKKKGMKVVDNLYVRGYGQYDTIACILVFIVNRRC